MAIMAVVLARSGLLELGNNGSHLIVWYVSNVSVGLIVCYGIVS
jgi:hypothetical protein